MQATVVVLTKNNAATLDEVLAAVFRQRLAGGYEVVHIDSGSTDQTLAIAARYPARRYQIAPAEFSHSGTRNLAARLARGEALVYLSADATPLGPDWLAHLLAPLDEPGVAGVYGRQVPRPTADPLEAAFLTRTYPAQGRRQQLAPDGRLRLPTLFFSNVTSALRKTVWQRHPFDERLHMSEDQGWARDVLRAGYRLAYQPRAAVHHSHHYTLGRLFRRNFDSGHSLAVLLRGERLGFAGYGAGCLARAVLEFARTQPRSLPRLLVYETVRAAGFFSGRQAHHLPGWLRRRCSDYPHYWQRYGQPPLPSPPRVMPSEAPGS